MAIALEHVLSSVFSTHKIKTDQKIVYGQGMIQQQAFHILGTVENTFLGVEEALTIADKMLDILTKDDSLPVLLLVDVIGQKLAMRDEWLGQYAYFGHLLECLHLMRKKGHRTFSLVYNQAIGGAFITFGAQSEKVFALTHATIAVMWLDAMSKVTKIDKSILMEISETSPVFAPGVENFKKLGGVHEVLTLNDVPQQLLNCLSQAPPVNDDRALLGYQLGGRTKAHPIIEKILGNI